MKDKKNAYQCTGTYKYLLNSDNTCYQICPSKFINEEGTECKTGDTSECYFIDELPNKKCFSQCPERNKYHNDDSHQCRPDCITK